MPDALEPTATPEAKPHEAEGDKEAKPYNSQDDKLAMDYELPGAIITMKRQGRENLAKYLESKTSASIDELLDDFYQRLKIVEPHLLTHLAQHEKPEQRRKSFGLSIVNLAHLYAWLDFFRQNGYDETALGEEVGKKACAEIEMHKRQGGYVPKKGESTPPRLYQRLVSTAMTPDTAIGRFAWLIDYTIKHRDEKDPGLTITEPFILKPEENNEAIRARTKALIASMRDFPVSQKTVHRPAESDSHHECKGCVYG